MLLAKIVQAGPSFRLVTIFIKYFNPSKADPSIPLDVQTFRL